VRPSLSLVVPVFNEQDRFAEHAGELAGFVRGYGPGSELLVVDDGSADATVEAVEKFIADQHDQAVRLLRRPHEGKGAAVRAGLLAASGRYAGFCDVDLSTPLAELAQVVAAARMSRVLAIGSRDAAASHLVRAQRPLRERLGKGYNRLVQLTVAPGLTDTQCGAKVAAAEAGRRHALHALAGSGERLPLADGSASVVCLLDVIEHLEDQGATLREAWRVLEPGGHLVVTVPAHAWLWSEADELLGHVRRYTRPLLRAHLAEAGFTPVHLTHVFSWLLAPVWAARRVAALRGRAGRGQLGLDRSSAAVAGAAFLLTRAELGLAGRLSLPAGTSGLCVAAKPGRGRGRAPGAAG